MNKKILGKIFKKPEMTSQEVSDNIASLDGYKKPPPNPDPIRHTGRTSADSINSLEDELSISRGIYGDEGEFYETDKQWKQRKKQAEKTPSPSSPKAKKPSPSTSSPKAKKRSPSPSSPKAKKPAPSTYSPKAKKRSLSPSTSPSSSPSTSPSSHKAKKSKLNISRGTKKLTNKNKTRRKKTRRKKNRRKKKTRRLKK